MSVLLIGNGINIQYGGSRFLNREIIKRVISSVDDPDFPLEATTFTDRLQPLWLIGTLFSEIHSIVDGAADELLSASFERIALRSFKERYEDFYINPSPFNIGMEDYFFLLEIFFKKNGVHNPDAHAIRESLKRVFAYAICDAGNLEKIYRNYPEGLDDFFSAFDSIFTTNYDSNIESFTQRRVGHLHGCFSTLSYVYDADSFRNQLSDDPMSSNYFDSRYPYLFSNAIFSYSGELKRFQMNQALKTNQALEKFAESFANGRLPRTELEAWLNDSNSLVHNLAESILLKRDNPNLQFEEYYPIDEFCSATGTLSIVGLSPNNDTHIFDLINSNARLSSVRFYYHSKSEITSIQQILQHDNILFMDVRELWAKHE